MRVFSLICVLLLALPAHAQLVLEDLSLLINQTVSPTGQEFYRAFAAEWNTAPPKTAPEITLRERASARQGSQMTVELDRNPILTLFVPFNLERSRKLARDAAVTVRQQVSDRQVEQLLFGRDPDIASDGF